MTATATVSVILEVDINSNWGDDCTIGQIKSQTMDSARGILSNMISINGKVSMKGDIECVSIKYVPNK